MKHNALLLVAIAALAYSTTLALASGPSYWVMKSVPAIKAKGTPPVKPAITLSETLLPEGMDGTPYNFDFKTVTSIAGGPGIGGAQFAVGTGALPQGLALSSDGVLSGSPAELTAGAGATFGVVGTYVDATGQQVYTLKVGEKVLEAVQIAAGGIYTCALTPGGAVKCWGNGSAGLLGNGVQGTSTTPVQVLGLTSGVTSIAAGEHQGCAVRAGTVWCWGTTTSVPVQIGGLSGVTAVSVGTSHACAVAAGAPKCWGTGTSGQLGNGASADSPTPLAVAGITSGVTSISAGNEFTCAVRSGAVFCWGYGGNGRLGNGAATNSNVPVQVADIASAIKVSAGSAHACAIDASVAKCWGSNGNGQLGDGSQIERRTPVAVSGSTPGYTDIAASNSFTCGVETGSAKCWGVNNFGQLGQGGTASVKVPTQVAGLTSGVTIVSAKSNHTCAVHSGKAKCWGWNIFGAIGDGTTSDRRSPANVKPGA